MKYPGQIASFERNVHHEELELNSGFDSESEAGDVLSLQNSAARSVAN